MSAFSLAGQTSHTVAAPRTVERRDLDAELILLRVAQSLFPFGARCSRLGLGRQERTDHSVRTNVRALVALDTLIDLPFGDIDGDAALLPCSGSVLPRTIFTSVECPTRAADLPEGIDRIDDVAHELRTSHIHAVIGRFQLDIRPLGPGTSTFTTCVTARIRRPP